MMRIHVTATAFLLPVTLAAEPLELDDCIDRALRHNLDLQVAEQGVMRSVADTRAARADRLPSLTANLFRYNRSRTGPSVRVQENPTGQVDPVTGQRIVQEERTLIPAIDRDSYSLSASLSYTFFDGGRRANNRRASRRRLENAELDLSARESDVVAGVKAGYYELLKAQELVEVQKEALRLGEKQLEDAEVRLEVGSGTEVDVLRLKVALGNAQSHLIDARQGVVLAKAQLNHRMGAEVTAPIEVAPMDLARWQAPAVGDSLPELVDTAVRNNPTARGLAMATLATEHELKAARSAWYPRLGGNLSYSRDNEVFDRVVHDLDQNYRLNLGLSLTHDVFDGGLRQANVDRSRAALETARINADQLRRNLALAIQTERLELARLVKQLTLGERTVKLAEEDLLQAQERYRLGKGRLLEVLDAQVNLTQARGDLVRTRYDLMIAETELDRLLGTRRDT